MKKHCEASYDTNPKANSPNRKTFLVSKEIKATLQLIFGTTFLILLKMEVAFLFMCHLNIWDVL